MSWSNIRFGIVALLVLFVVGWSRADDPIRVTDDQSFVTLRGGQYVSNFGEVWNRTKPLRIHGMPDAAGKKPKVGLVWHRPQHPRPGDGTKVNTSLHGCLLQSITFTGQFDISAFYNSGVEEGTYINVVVDAQCGVAKAVFSTADAWGLGFPHGPTLSGGNIVSMRLYGSGGVGFLAVGEVTDLYAGQISTSGTGAARIQVHTVAPYQWPTWGGGTATSQGMPKRIAINDARMAEGVYETGIIYSKQAANLVQPPTVSLGIGGPWAYQSKTLTIGLAIPGGDVDGLDDGTVDNPPQPSGLPAGIAAPEWGLDVRTDAPPNRTFSGGAFPYAAVAGDVIEIAPGNYPAGMGSGYMQLEARGTRERPVIVRGVGRPRLGQKLYLRNSSYVYITGFDATKIEVGENCDHWVIADCRIGEGSKLEWINSAPVFAPRKGGGLAIAAPDAKPTTHGLVIRCQIVDNGDFALGESAETHGITINGAVSEVTVLDCELARNSGDGMQINGGAMDYSGTDPQCKLNNIRIGKVDAHDNRQVGIALKQCADVVLSGVKSHGHRPYGPSPSSWGAGFGAQYGPARVWMINCEAYDNVSGVSGGSSNGPGGAWYFINFNAHDNSRTWPADLSNAAATGWVAAGPGNVTHPRLQAPGDSWGPAGMAIAGSPDVTVIGATLRNNDAGLNFPGGQRVQILGSLIDGLQQPEGNAAFIYDTQYLRDFAFVGNAIASGSDRFQRGGQRSGLAAWLAAFGSVARSNGNVIAPSGTWTPTAADRAVFDEFKRRYGLDIDVDFSGAARPATRKIGATER